MNMKIAKLLLGIIFVMGFITSCDDKVEINIQKGEGTIIYEGKSYDLDYLSIYTSPKENGLFEHNVVVTNSGDGNIIFYFSIVDKTSQNTISPGEYITDINTDYSAHFSVNEGIGDYLHGTLTAKKDRNEYTFQFDGVTIDENSPTKEVSFSYKGKSN
ncbi:hypothetical protein LJB98_02390 [Bacteroidales bacterium OttesenSCG-928-M11]|nr:hypothetical protein [Bacteroidales bacterium OttesenSCG-928-M11]